jgi:DNA polymerase-3 subunit gamma/tau
MAYEVLARKWRPQQFEDVVGQDHVTRTLRNAIEAGRIAHAYIFVGPRGTGKTSLARIFAKSLNCEKGTTVTPCGTCDCCREITAGNSMDVLEIDGASNNGVDQVRDLRDTARYRPAHARFKIFIIDEVHMLSTAAFNALLKTLEEPPPHVKFIFATTEPQKVLATILSRCQRFDLRRIPTPLIVERLKLIADSEKVEIGGDALLAVARGAEGGLRDAESAFDQLIAFQGRKIEEEDVLSVFGLVSRRTLEDLGESILKGDIRRIIEGIGKLDEAGKDLHRLVIELLDHFRNLLICASVKDPGAVADLTEAQLETLRAQVRLADTERLLRVTDVLVEAQQNIRQALSRRTLLETTLIRCARAAVTVSLDEILAQIQELRGLAPAGAPGGSAPPSVVREAPAPVAPSSSSAVRAPAPSPAHAAAPSPAAVGEDPLAVLQRSWQDVITRAGKLSVAIKSLLPDTRPLRAAGDKIVIGVDEEFKERLEELQVPRNRKTIEIALHDVLHRKVEVEFESASMKPARAEGGRPAADVSPAKEEPEKKPAAARSRRDMVDDPAVQKTLKAFGGTIREVRE